MGNDMNCFKKLQTSPEVKILRRFGSICSALKMCRVKYKPNVRKELNALLDQLDILIETWQGELPDLGKFLSHYDIDWLLTQAVINARTRSQYEREKRIVKFVADTGHKDEPDLVTYGKSILRRITPIHHAHNHSSGATVIHDLFRIYNGFDVNYTDEDGSTHFHLACEYGCTDAVRKFLELGADPNSALNRNKWTSLHYVCHCSYDRSELIEVFFNVNDELNRLVWIDARDKWGQTPLHLALSLGCKKTAETLLRRGADPNLADEDGSTPLHSICQKYWNDDLAKMFCDINDELNQRVQVDAKDKSGRTPLRLAVANLKPNTVDVLLDGRSNLSRFIFPNESNFDDGFEMYVKAQIEHKLILASGLMAVVERLEKSEYELDRSDALIVMKLFAKYGLFEKSANLAKCWYDDDEFATEAKKTMVNSSLTLYDLIRLRPEEAAKLLTYEDCYKFSRAVKPWKFTEYHCKAYGTHLSEKISRRFFWRWAMDPFMELINYRLPHLPCEMIMDNLKNEDFYHICLAALGQIRDGYKRIRRFSHV